MAAGAPEHHEASAMAVGAVGSTPQKHRLTDDGYVS
jgi:hypothetical protein